MPRNEAKDKAKVRTDSDVLLDNYRFVRTEEDDGKGKAWEVDMAKEYYAKLFREYALIDLSKYKKGKYGCRWRTKQEVVAGKGQTSCGSLDCKEEVGLETYEVPFGYAEEGREKLALVKVRLCQKHAMQLQYKKMKAAVKEKKKIGKVKLKAEKQAKDKKKNRKEKREGPESRKEEKREEPTFPKSRPTPANDKEAAVQKEADEFLAQLLV